MPVHELSSAPPEVFLAAVGQLRDVVRSGLRPEVTVEEVPAPRRIAPYAAALSADVAADGEERATGRFILLHDPSSPTAWQGSFRIVSFVRAAMDSEVATDPLLGEVGWSWLADALAGAGDPGCRAAGGTVTRAVSETFGDLAGPPPSVELEIRASWTPSAGSAVGAHLSAWASLLGTIAGLPPVHGSITRLSRSS